MHTCRFITFSIPSLYTSSAYWNATRAFMILSAMSCFAGIIAGILSFAHFSAFERFNRSFAAGIMFFVSSESCIRHIHIHHSALMSHSFSLFTSHLPQMIFCIRGIFILCNYQPNVSSFTAGPLCDFQLRWSLLARMFALMHVTICLSRQPSLFCLLWPFTLEWLWTSWASASGTGASLGPTF